MFVAADCSSHVKYYVRTPLQDAFFEVQMAEWRGPERLALLRFTAGALILYCDPVCVCAVPGSNRLYIDKPAYRQRNGQGSGCGGFFREGHV
jgi:hypothetical protein